MIENQPLIVHTAGKPEPEIPELRQCPDFSSRLPNEIARFTQTGVYDDGDNEHLSFTQGSGHGGSHPHLIHQFVTLLCGQKDAYPNTRESANITCVGILAHESAMAGGVLKHLPDFTLKRHIEEALV